MDHVDTILDETRKKYEKEFEENVKERKDKHILILEKESKMLYTNYLEKVSEILFIIHPNICSSNWTLSTVPNYNSKEVFEKRMEIPEWCKDLDGFVEFSLGNTDVFRLLADFETKEQAISAAKEIIRKSTEV